MSTVHDGQSGQWSIVSADTGTRGMTTSTRPPSRWIPGFMLDLACLFRGHKPHQTPPFMWTTPDLMRWEFCARCGRFFGRKA